MLYTLSMIQKKRPKLDVVGIRKEVKDKLYEYIHKLDPRPIVADVVSVAVIEYLERQRR